MHYCTICLNLTTRPNTKFSDDGKCYACKNFVGPEEIDWAGRKEHLDGIRAFAKKHNQSGHDCIVGVSGGKDSLRQAMYLRDELGFNPLLVSMNFQKPTSATTKRAGNFFSTITFLKSVASTDKNPVL